MSDITIPPTTILSASGDAMGQTTSTTPQINSQDQTQATGMATDPQLVTAPTSDLGTQQLATDTGSVSMNAILEQAAEQLEQAAEALPVESSLSTPPNSAPELVSEPQPESPVTSQSTAPFSAASIALGADTLLDILLTKNLITDEQKQQVISENLSTGKTIESIIATRQLVNEEELTKATAQLHDIPFVKIAETGTDPQAITKLPEGVAKKYSILPLRYDIQDNTLFVAMLDPLNLAAIDFAEQKSGTKLSVAYAMPSELERTLAEHYSQSLSGEVTAALEQTTQVSEAQEKKQDFKALSGETIREAPITKIVHTIVEFAMKARASDVHIEPQEQHTRVRYRIDGILMEKLVLPSSVHDAVVSRIKILSDLKIDEKRVPQDGRFSFSSQGQDLDLRVSTLPTINGEKIVMRLLKKDATVPSLPELGLTGLALRNVEDASKVPHGIVLVTGPTGSGKTTTLYSVLHRINTPKVNIMTLEDPVEYQMAGVNQVQINPQAGLTFASGLRSFLRQDPNIIMVGEIRDSETAELAVQASLTGHLVFSTLHTSSAAGAIPRLLDMGAEPFLLASSITLVMAQRVVRKINPDFMEEYTPEPAVVEDIKVVLGDKLDQWCKQKGISVQDITLYRVKADKPYTEPDYKGRVGIFEVMRINERMSKLILDSRPARELEAEALKDGMLLMKQDGYIKALEGITTIEEVLRVAEI